MSLNNATNEHFHGTVVYPTATHSCNIFPNLFIEIFQTYCIDGKHASNVDFECFASTWTCNWTRLCVPMYTKFEISDLSHTHEGLPTDLANDRKCLGVSVELRMLYRFSIPVCGTLSVPITLISTGHAGFRKFSLRRNV